jgi:acid phosphatase type 7
MTRSKGLLACAFAACSLLLLPAVPGVARSSPRKHADRTPPTAPSGVTATAGDAKVTLSWGASTDRVGVTGYRVYRGIGGNWSTTPIGTTSTSTRTYTNTPLTNGTTYSYFITAVDAAGNESAHSSTVSATPGVSPTPSPPGGDPRITAAGDIADSGGGDTTTAALVNSLAPTRALTLGDNAYPDGTSSDYASYYGPTWGGFRTKTSPSPGNHDYHTAGAAGYFGYFGGLAPAPYYSFNLGAWHLISLNSEISMAAGSAQETWLKNDLAASNAACTLAYWHKPRWTSGSSHANTTATQPLVQDLYNAGAEVLLAGHNHQYERFAPQNPSSQADSQFGLREFVAGTGGAPRYTFATAQPNSQVRNNSTWGVLQMTLHSGSYDWSFKPSQASAFTDSGTTACHGKPG